jgi:hypothetical protein
MDLLAAVWKNFFPHSCNLLHIGLENFGKWLETSKSIMAFELHEL